MASVTSKQKHHALAIPLPSQGHVNPLMRFCKRLAAQEGFTITFIDIAPVYVTSEQEQHPSNLQHEDEQTRRVAAADVQTAGGKRPEIRRIRIAMPNMSEVINLSAAAGPLERFFAALDMLAPQIEELLLKLLQQEPPVTCLISDFYMTGATQNVADKLKLPRVALHTTSQSLLLFKHYLQEGALSFEEVLKVLQASDKPRDNIFKEGLEGLPTIKVGDLTLQTGESRFLLTHDVKSLQETRSKAHAIVVNSSVEIEEDALKVNIGIPVYDIGPLVEPLEKEANISFWTEDETCMLWLDSQPPSSVLFISFGSVASLPLTQFEEFVAGLVSSQQRFLWVFRPDLVQGAPYTTFPQEILNKTNGKGYATPWAPQVKVLSHPSIHGFLTHCGWNSTLEAISHGVPMICFPCLADQFMNAKFIIEEWKVGLGFTENKESGLISRYEIERVIRTVMESKEGEYLHTNARYLGEKCTRSNLPEGHAFNNIQALVRSLE